MTMQSSNLLPALRELPGGEPGQNRSFRDTITGIVNMDRAMYAAEFASATSFGLWYIFDDRTLLGVNVPFTGINVDDSWRETLNFAHNEMAFQNETRTVWQHYRDALENPENLDNSFISPLKGSVAEIMAKEQLAQQGYTELDFPRDAAGEIISNNPGWDLHGYDPNGEYTRIQIKTGASDSQYYDTLEAMQETDYPFALGSELHERISESAPELADQIVADIGPDHLLVDGITDGLDTLSSNMGIDIPDGIGEIVPYAGAIISGARLVYSVLKTEKEFKAVDRTAKNKIQVVQSLTLMSRMGITTVLATAGGMGGGAIGSVFPGVGNLVGGLVGTFTGAGVGMYLNRHLQPHMLNLALNITGLTNDDLFYYKNKVRIDNAALSYQERARALAAPA